MIDWGRIDELRDEIGEKDYAEVIELFFEEVDAAIGRLHGPGSLPEREADLHFLKGSALNLGFAGLGALCEKAEHGAHNGTLDDADVLAVIETYHASRSAFEAGRAAA